MDFNELINTYYKTDKGYLYLVDLIKLKFPTLKINEEVLKTLKIDVMGKEEFLKTGFTGIYVANENTIRIFLNKDSNGNKIVDYDFTDVEIINTFLHELIHALTSKVDANGNCIEGLNMRTADGENSFLLPFNEGITQMIADDIMEYESDAYPFFVNFARQIANVIGKDNLLYAYSSNDPNVLVDEIGKYSKEFNTFKFIEKIYYFDLICRGYMQDGGYNLGSSIQQDLINLHKNTNTQINQDLLLDVNKIKKYMEYIPFSYSEIDDLGFGNIEEIIGMGLGVR
jgi:hypothetical protein